jgi:hypothetical protein
VKPVRSAEEMIGLAAVASQYALTRLCGEKTTAFGESAKRSSREHTAAMPIVCIVALRRRKCCCCCHGGVFSMIIGSSSNGRATAFRWSSSDLVRGARPLLPRGTASVTVIVGAGFLR